MRLLTVFNVPCTMLGPCVYSFIFFFSQVPSEADQIILFLRREIKDQKKQRSSHGLTHNKEKAKSRLEPRSVWLQPNSVGG